MRTTSIVGKRVAVWHIQYESTSSFVLAPLNSLFFNERAAKAAAIRMLERFKENNSGKATVKITPLYRDTASGQFLPGRGSITIEHEYRSKGY